MKTCSTFISLAVCAVASLMLVACNNSTGATPSCDTPDADCLQMPDAAGDVSDAPFDAGDAMADVSSEAPDADAAGDVSLDKVSVVEAGTGDGAAGADGNASDAPESG